VLEYIARGLRESGFTVDQTGDGKDGLLRASTENYDALVVDRMLPGMDGLSIIRTLRGADNNTPALILSALGEVDDRVKGLKAGGDDYLVKPFAFAELLARIEALLRRKDASVGRDPAARRGPRDGPAVAQGGARAASSLNLQPREFRLLEYLMKHAGQVVTRTMLLENVWDYHFDPQTNVIDVHISRLRQKLDKDFDKPAAEDRARRGVHAG
jgi:two-component system OmpR family response regulator